MSRNKAMKALSDFLRPEFLSRVDEVVVFDPLGEEQLRQIAARQQAPDHPILWNVPETDYLKFYLFQVV